MTAATDVVIHGRTELAIDPEQVTWNVQQLAALEHLGVAGAARADLAVFYHQCVKTGLDPFAKQIYMIERQGKQTIQTGIDGFRLVGRRAADRARHSVALSDTLWCGEDGKWVDVWLSDKLPAAAKVTVYRNGDPFPAVAVFKEYAGRKRDGSINSMWSSKGSLMIAKCAEALAWRKAFPQDLSGIFISEELAQDMAGEEPQDNPGPSSRSSVSRLRAAVPESTPAEPAADSAITKEQLSKLAALLKDEGFTDAAEGLEYIAEHAGREVKASRDLTYAEAAAVIAALEARSDPDAVVDAVVVPDEPATDEPPAEDGS